MAELDSILSGQGAPAPVPGEVEAPKVIDQAQAEASTEGAEIETHEGEGGQKMVPHEALHAEKQKVKRYTEQVASFEKTLADREAAWERRFEQLIGAVKPQQAVEPQKVPDFWEDPNAAISSALTPVQQQMQKNREEFSRVIAEEKHGAETVSAAFQALRAELQSNPAAQAQYQAIMQSAHPYGALVDWHKKRAAAAEIGDDPAAYREKLKAEILAEMQGTPPANASAPTPVMPSNLAGARNVGTRSGPAWSGPQSLNDIFDRRSPKG